MAMNFIKGLVGGQNDFVQPGQVMNPYAQPPGAQQGQPGQPGQQSTFMSPEAFAAQQQQSYGQPPQGGVPQQAYVPPGAQQGPGGAPQGPSQYGVAGQGMGGQSISGQAPSGQGISGQGISGQGISGQGISGQGVTGQGQPTVADLQRDLDAMALFARTLLTILEEKNVLTRAEFQEVHNRLDMLDGKLDGRVGDGK